MKILNKLTLALAIILPTTAMLPMLPGPHADITRRALTNISIPAGSNTLVFSEKAIQQIIDENNNTDGLSVHQFDSEFHFDSENFLGASQNIVDLRKQIIDALKNDCANGGPDGKKARELLGTALHIIQDFYAHTSWVENAGGNVNGSLGISSFTFFDTSDNRACVAGQPGTLLPGVISSGFVYIGSGPYDYLCQYPANKCRHGFRGVCPDGISKDYDGRPNFAIAARLAGSSTEDFVNGILNDPDIKDKIPAKKALLDAEDSFTVVIDTTGSMSPIIDGVKSAIAGIVFQKQLNDTPSEYILLSFNDPIIDPPLKTCDSVEFLARLSLLTADGGGDCPEPSQQALFNGVRASKEGSTVYLFTDADAKDGGLASSVAAQAKKKKIKINVQLHGTCTPAALSVSQNTLNNAHDSNLKSNALLIDALPIPPWVDASRQPQVMRARSNNNSFLNTASARNPPPVISPYKIDVSESGGMLMNLNGTAQEAQSGFDVTKAVLGNKLTSVFIGNGTMGNKAKSQVVSLDTSITKAIFSISLNQLQSITLLRPSGQEVTPGQPGVTETDLTSAKIIKIDSPEPGNWMMRLSGSGGYSIEVLALSPISIVDVDFVEKGGRIGHEGFFPIPGQPVIGKNQIAMAKLSGTPLTASFSLSSEDGTTLQAIGLNKNYPDAGVNDYVGALVPPGSKFRFIVSGKNPDGSSYQRVFPTLFIAQPLEVRIALSNSVINFDPYNYNECGTIVITNWGITDQFNYRHTTIRDKDNAGEGGYSYFGSDVTIATGQSIQGHDCSITSSPTYDSVEGDVHSIYIEAFSVTDNTHNNVFSAKRAFSSNTTTTNSPPDCINMDQGPFEIQVTTKNNHQLVPIDIKKLTRIDDPNGNPISISVNTITQDEIVSDGSRGDQSPDGAGVGTEIAQVRAERNKSGNGRMYQVTFTATDDLGASCRRSLYVAVPLSASSGPATDDGQNYDSTLP
jgi:hypothetical protein